ncbi:protein phosphatase methylesterase 1 [Gaeumannomyces tritici R3-111a-1]|uniref:Protein phosphatase methylesterase 1 n=1 Tax=Gaeumannomyces tritici (strain R3-111a-1) TaxID=644352 RepID=J3PKK4_GAET3|nr:protein phosphatase methylesterase 1 [Gaeumannomyces tritici R3-111a-1]EJT68359.1 protein phosphatase methylesterase 1 [Gaeumannomyces tritici R3-111a-1]
MSELQRKWAKTRAAQPPDALLVAAAALDEQLEDGATADIAEAPEDEGETGTVPELPEFADDDSSSASSASSTGTVVPSPRQNLFARPQGFPRGRTMDVIPWTTYFERELFLEIERDGGSNTVTFHTYLTSPVGKGPLFVMHHGAGSSGLSFAVVGAEIRKRNPSAGILSLDARGHGSTTVAAAGSSGGGGDNKQQPPTPPPPPDLSLGTLAADLLAVIRATGERMGWANSSNSSSSSNGSSAPPPQLPPIVLVGHSLGGAVVTHLASTGALGDDGGLLGYVVLDVVEGSAMDALQSMQTYLSTRPAGFSSVQAAVDWHVRSRTVRNSVSARTSVPGLLVRREEEEGGGGGGDDAAAAARPWRWRTDLAATQPFWEGWFVGLSKKFLSARGGKLLLLAGTDRLDTELTIGQMQGKYALQVFTEAGHFVHEDLPEKTAIALVDFHRRNDRTSLVLPPKVSELLAQGKRV